MTALDILFWFSALIFFGFFAFITLCAKKGTSQYRRELEKAIDDAADNKALIIWPNPVKEAFDGGRVQNITDIVS